MEIHVDIGCGNRKHTDADIGVDVRRTGDVDVQADARSLPFADETISEITSIATVEHVRYKDIGLMFDEWYRVLEPGGNVWILTPNLLSIIENLHDQDHYKFQRKLFGGWTFPTCGDDDYEENRHACLFTPGLIRIRLEESGFTNITIEEQVSDGANWWNMGVYAGV